MQISSVNNAAWHVHAAQTHKPEERSLENVTKADLESAKKEQEVHDAFCDFAGQTFFGQMLHAMRKSVGKPAYMYGGRTEEVFQAQLDQVLAEKMSAAAAESFVEPMYQLFSLQRPF